MASPTAITRLALFDLDHTLLDGDSDVLWCDFLLARGILEQETFAARNEQMAHDYRSGTVSALAFCEFYVSTLATRTRLEWEPLRREFLSEVDSTAHRCQGPRAGAAASGRR